MESVALRSDHFKCLDGISQAGSVCALPCQIASPTLPLPILRNNHVVTLVRMPLWAFCLGSLGVPLPHGVLAARNRLQMRRIDTPAVAAADPSGAVCVFAVAAMIQLHPVRDWANVYFVEPSVCGYFACSAVWDEGSVAVGCAVGCGV